MVTSLTNTRMSIHMDWRGNVDSHDELQELLLHILLHNEFLFIPPPI